MCIQQGAAADPIRAVVSRVQADHVTAFSSEDVCDLRTSDPITFSLADWSENEPPECGDEVELISTALYHNGWSAKAAHPFRTPSQPIARRA